VVHVWNARAVAAGSTVAMRPRFAQWEVLLFVTRFAGDGTVDEPVQDYLSVISLCFILVVLHRWRFCSLFAEDD